MIVLPTKTITKTTINNNKGKSGFQTNKVLESTARVIVSPINVKIINISAANNHPMTNPMAVLDIISWPLLWIGVVSIDEKEGIAI